MFHSKVYISLFFFFFRVLESLFCFGTACVWTAYELSAVLGAFPKVLGVTRRHWTLCKAQTGEFVPFLRGVTSGEQHPPHFRFKLLRCVFKCSWPTAKRRKTSEGKRGEKNKRKWVNRIRKSCFFTIGSASLRNVKGAILSLLRHTKMLLWMTFFFFFF